MTGNFICLQCIGQGLPFNCMIHDDEFMNAIIDYEQIPSKLIFEKLNELLFDPFEMNDDICNFNEEDYQYLCNDITNLNYKYYDVDKFVINNNVPKSFSLMHINVYCLNYNFTVIGISETWFTVDNVDCYKLLGFNIINHVRTDRIGGGASLMIRNTIHYTVRSDLKVFGTYIECIFIEIEGILINYDINVIIGTVYRPPATAIKEFNESISLLLVKIQNEKNCP